MNSLTSVTYHSAGCLSLFSEGAAIGQSMEERRMTVAALNAIFRATGFPFHVVPLEQVCTCDSFCIILRLRLKIMPVVIGNSRRIYTIIIYKRLSGSGPSQWNCNDSATIFRRTCQCLQSSRGWLYSEQKQKQLCDRTGGEGSIVSTCSGVHDTVTTATDVIC